MIKHGAYWIVGEKLEWSKYGKKEVARHGNKMVSLEIDVKADFDVEGWEVEGHFITPFAQESREFVGLDTTIVDGKAVFALEGTVTKYPGDWKVELILKGAEGEEFPTPHKLKYTVEKTAAGQSYNEILNEADSSTVDAAREGLENAITEAGTTKEGLEETITTAGEKDSELKATILDGENVDTALKATTQAAETKDTELKQSIIDGETKKQEIIEEGDYQYNRIKEPVDGLEKRVDDVEEIVVSDTIRVGLYNPNDGLPTPVSNYGNQYWEANADGLLDIPGIGETDVEQYSKLYWMDGSRWEYISARSDLLPKGEGLEAQNAKELENQIKEQGEQIQNLSIGTIAEAQAITGLQEGDIVNLEGYYTKGDGAHHKRIFSLTNDGTGEQTDDLTGYLNILKTDSYKLSWFGAIQDATTDDTTAVKKALKFMANGIELDKTKEYTEAEINTIRSTLQGEQGKSLTFDSSKPARVTESLVVPLASELKAENSCSMYSGNRGGIFTDHLDDIGFSTDFFLETANGSGLYKLVTTKEEVEYLVYNERTPDNPTRTWRCLTQHITLGIGFSHVPGTPIGVLFSGNNSLIENCAFGTSDWFTGAGGSRADVALVLLQAFTCNFDNIGVYGNNQCLVGWRCNTSTKFGKIYGNATDNTGVNGGTYRILPVSITYDYADSGLMFYFAMSNQYISTLILEGVEGKWHGVAVDEGFLEVENLYAETHTPAHAYVTIASAFNDASVKIKGGFISNLTLTGVNEGFVLYCEDVDSEVSQDIHVSRYIGAQGTLYKAINSQCSAHFRGLMAYNDYDNIGVIKHDDTETDTRKIFLYGTPPDFIRLEGTNSFTMRSVSDLKKAFAMLGMWQGKVSEIHFYKNDTLTEDLDCDILMKNYLLGNAKIKLKGYNRYIYSNGFKIKNLRAGDIEFWQVKLNITTNHLIELASQNNTYNFGYCTFEGNKAVMLITEANRVRYLQINVNIHNANWSTYAPDKIVGCYTGLGSFAVITLSVYNTLAEILAVCANPIANMPLGELKTSETSTNKLVGTTAQRPSAVQKNYQYFDETLGKPIWYNGTNWVDSSGTIV